MEKVKCEFCGYEQDPEVSIICDNCGRRLGRTRIDFTPEPESEKENEEHESVRCPNCGVPTSHVTCPNCGAMVVKRSI